MFGFGKKKKGGADITTPELEKKVVEEKKDKEKKPKTILGKKKKKEPTTLYECLQEDIKTKQVQRQKLLDLCIQTRNMGVYEFIFRGPPEMANGQVVALSGSDPDVGDWQPEKAVVGTDVGGGWWHMRFPKPNGEYEFKFVVLSPTGEAIKWEEVASRKMAPSSKYRCMSTWDGQ